MAMMTRQRHAPLLALLALLSLLGSACRTAPPELPPGTRLGEAIEPAPILAFAAVDAEPALYFEQTLLVEATAVAVCQKAGCWMQIEDEGHTAMVRWETGCGGAYRFPADVIGKRIVIQGSFYPKQLSPADAEHLREEAAGPLELELDGYEFNATSVLVRS